MTVGEIILVSFLKCPAAGFLSVHCVYQVENTIRSEGKQPRSELCFYLSLASLMDSLDFKNRLW